MSREKDCCWHFEHHTGRAEGPSNAMMQNFKEKPYSSLVREAIQNSLDAVADETKPVRIVFSFKSIDSINFERFFDLRDHIQGCIDYFPTDEKAKTLYGGMLKNFPDTRTRRSIDYIRVSDFNTKGMWYLDDKHTNSPFFAFVRAAGVSAKEDAASGGSYGFGKAAYYQISPIATIIVSTMTRDEHYAFEGAAALCTHKVGEDIKTSVGYYDNNDGQPVKDLDNIPVPFRRKEPGTDINIMGFNLSNTDEAKREIVEAVLKNFWYAIVDMKLEVEVDDVNITNSTIGDWMKQYFPNIEDNTRKSGYYNPRPYYEAVVNADIDDDHQVFSDMLPLLGDVTLYVLKDKNATDKVAYFRKPKMLVYAKRTTSTYGVYGTFICSNREGNEILKQLEDPSHSIWKATNWRDGNNRIVQRGMSALELINDFVMQSIASMFETTAGDETAVTNLEDYLFVPSDLVPEDEDVEQGNNPFAGAESGETETEGTSITTDVVKPMEDKTTEKNNIGTVHVIETGKQTPAADPKETDNYAEAGIHTRSAGKKKKKGKGNSAGDTREFVPVDPDALSGMKTYVPVHFRAIAQKEGAQIVHHIVIHSDYDIPNGEIELMVGGEMSDEVINIAHTDQGKVRGNIVSNLRLTKGRNTIKVRFNDNMRYTIKLKAYEIK